MKPKKPYVRLTESDKERIRKAVSPNKSIHELKKELNLDSSYDRIRVFVSQNNLPYRIKGEHIGLDDAPKSKFFNVMECEDWLLGVRRVGKYQNRKQNYGG